MNAFLLSLVLLGPLPDPNLLLRLKTTAICLIYHKKTPPQLTVTALYDFLRDNGIPHPHPSTPIAQALWNAAAWNAKQPGVCDKLLLNPTITSI